jgi:hypothetical protein
MSGQKITISEPTSKWGDVFPQDSAPPASLQTTGEIKEPFAAIIFAQTPLFRQTATGFQSRHATACNIFPGTVEEFDAYEQRRRDEAEAAKEGARQAAREAVKAKEEAEPKPAPGILPSAENMTTKRHAYRINDIVTADDDAWKNFISDKHFGLSTREFFDRIGYADDALLHFAPGGTRRYSEVRDNLDGFLRVDPNGRLVGQIPPRRFAVSRFERPATRGIRITEHLRSMSKAKLIAVVFDATDGGVESWWDVAALSQKKLGDFYRQSLILGALNQSGRAGFMAVMPGAPVSAAKHSVEPLLTEAGISLAVKPADKNHVLFFEPYNLPDVPSKGRSV